MPLVRDGTMPLDFGLGRCSRLAVLGVGYVEELLGVMSEINLLHLIFIQIC